MNGHGTHAKLAMLHDHARNLLNLSAGPYNGINHHLPSFQEPAFSIRNSIYWYL